MINQLKKLIEMIRLRILIMQLKLRIKLFKEKRTLPDLDWPRYIIIHHEAGNAGFWGVNEWHRQKWGFKSSLGFFCGYQWYLDKQKKWWHARADTEEGAHCPGKNKNSTGLCVMGNYKKEVLRDDLWDLLTEKVDELRAKYNIPRINVLGDKEGRTPSRPTTCPEELMGWIEWYRNN